MEVQENVKIGIYHVTGTMIGVFIKVNKKTCFSVTHEC